MTDWTDWYLVFNGGQTLVGKHVRPFLGSGDGDRMSPVYELNTSIRMDPSGKQAVGIQRHMSLPNFIDVPYVSFSFELPLVPVAKLSPGVQRELANGIAMAEEMRVKIRAAESGLVVP